MITSNQIILHVLIIIGLYFGLLSMSTCNALSNITQPTLVIVGTDDIWTPAANSLMIAEKIPAAWLVQVRDAGHGLMVQYPDKFSKVVSTFLQIVR